MWCLNHTQDIDLDPNSAWKIHDNPAGGTKDGFDYFITVFRF